MRTFRVEESRAVSHPFLSERVTAGKRLGTREFIAMVDGVEAGLLIFEHFPRDALGLVYEIYVLALFRGMGLGNLLLSHAQTVALISNCKSLRLMARSLDQATVDDGSLATWYGAKGFVPIQGSLGWMQKDLSIAG